MPYSSQQQKNPNSNRCKLKGRLKTSVFPVRRPLPGAPCPWDQPSLRSPAWQPAPSHKMPSTGIHMDNAILVPILYRWQNLPPDHPEYFSVWSSRQHQTASGKEGAQAPSRPSTKGDATAAASLLRGEQGPGHSPWSLLFLPWGLQPPSLGRRPANPPRSGKRRVFSTHGAVCSGTSTSACKEPHPCPCTLNEHVFISQAQDTYFFFKAIVRLLYWCADQ